MAMLLQNTLQQVIMSTRQFIHASLSVCFDFTIDSRCMMWVKINAMLSMKEMEVQEREMHVHFSFFLQSPISNT